MQQVGIAATQRRDPAPSRWAYRYQRLWLTPLFRRLVRVGLPVFVVVFVGAWLLADPANRQAISDKITELRDSVAERPEFMVKLMAIDGASDELGEDIREILPIDFPISSFDLDLEEMRGVIEDLDAVATADLRIKTGGILQLSIKERLPAVVWRNNEMLELLDATGRRVAAVAARGDRGDLPLIVGEGADAVVPEALALLAAAAPLQDRVRGLVRMGARRWDLVLDRDQRIMLPETRPVDALEQVIALDQAQDLLARDLSAVDMRNIERPTLRMGEQAVEELHRIKAMELGDPL